MRVLEVGACPIEHESKRNPFDFLRSEQSSQVIYLNAAQAQYRCHRHDP